MSLGDVPGDAQLRGQGQSLTRKYGLPMNEIWYRQCEKACDGEGLEISIQWVPSLQNLLRSGLIDRVRATQVQSVRTWGVGPSISWTFPNMAAPRARVRQTHGRDVAQPGASSETETWSSTERSVFVDCAYRFHVRQLQASPHYSDTK